MKHFLNIFVLLILTSFAYAIGFLVINVRAGENNWGLAYLPLIILFLLWGIKIREDYE
jgi:hypothetical protein